MLAANDMQTNIGLKVYAIIPDDDDDDEGNNAVLLSTMKQCIKRTENPKIYAFDIALEEKQWTHIFCGRLYVHLGKDMINGETERENMKVTCLLLKEKEKCKKEKATQQH